MKHYESLVNDTSDGGLVCQGCTMNVQSPCFLRCSTSPGRDGSKSRPNFLNTYIYIYDMYIYVYIDRYIYIYI